MTWVTPPGAERLLGAVTIQHLNGVEWWEAPRPHHWHRCKAQTRGTTSSGLNVERCPCGGVCIWRDGEDKRFWFERNKR